MRTPPGINPRDKRPDDRRPLAPSGRPAGAIWNENWFLLQKALAQAWILSTAGGQDSYSAFKQSIPSGHVTELVVEGHDGIAGDFHGAIMEADRVEINRR